ncbi:unnamed protein product [Heligmosomoides polygyrus]|uniref:WD_REPEATS_REGION domain-containing protein n=1 Tax=Heligmosomoides polygyrus TaxID=6339 RepID=A0A183G071_HELPZ|nr:unnamed protein product [Heligmosomoides polygyrus]
MADDLSTATLPQYSVPGPQIVGGTKYQQLLAVIEELGKDIRPTYTGNKICAERLKRSIAHSRILVRECLIEAEKDRQKAAADAARLEMPCSVKLPQRPAFVRSNASDVFVSTYQLDGSGSRVGSIYILSHGLDVARCIPAPAGVFRFEFLDPHMIIAAVTDGSLFTSSTTDPASSASFHVTDNVLLDVSSCSEAKFVSCTDDSGSVHIVDVAQRAVISSWKAHVLPYTNAGCEVWTCAIKGNMLCSGGEDARLKLWDIRCRSDVGCCTRFEAGVTFCSWQDENVAGFDRQLRPTHPLVGRTKTEGTLQERRGRTLLVFIWVQNG